MLYMIASRQPLDDALIRDVQEGLGHRVADAFRSKNPARTMEHLASLVVPAERQEDWDADVVPFHAGRAGRGRIVIGDEWAGSGGSGNARAANRYICDDYNCHLPVQQALEQVYGQGEKRPGRP